MFEKIKKRDGSIVNFEPERIIDAISKAGQATSEFDKNTARSLAFKALDFAGKKLKNHIPSVEEVQDVV